MSQTPSRSVPLFSTSVGNGPAVLLIQGVGVIGAGWSPQVDAMAGRFRMMAFDNRGIGSSPLGDVPLSIEVMADDAIGIMGQWVEDLDRHAGSRIRKIAVA